MGARLLTGMLTLVGLLTAPAAWAQAGPRELKKVHVLIVLETDSDLGPDLLKDGKRVRSLFEDHLARSRYTLSVLQGKDATRRRILAYYRSLKVGPDEGLVFYYAGHGGRTPFGRPHFFFEGESERPLFRDELRSAMEAKKAGLVVLLTDCCSNVVMGPPPPEFRWFAMGPPEEALVLKSLFFRARGTVDITAATGDLAYGDDKGGIFTRVLCRLILRPVKKFDRNHDRVVTWQEFFPVLQRETETTFKSWSEEKHRRGERVEVEEQQPQAYALGTPLERTGSRNYAVVTLANRANRVVHYRYRWSNETRWTSATLVPGDQTLHTQWLKDATVAHLQTQFREPVQGPSVLSPQIWTGKSQPTARDGRHYTVQIRK